MNKRKLNIGQERVLREIKQVIDNLVGEYSSAPDNFYTYEPGFVNAIGIFGERGAGKSTLLVELYRRSIMNGHYDISGVIGLEKLHFISPIDCSILAEIKTPSAVVLLHIKHSLENELQQQNYYENKGEIVELLKELDPLIGHCTRIDEEYRKLYLELSTTPSDYDHYQQQGIKERFLLKRNLGNWLIKVRALINFKSFVILLDDFDLSPGVQVQAWINAFLDELQQVGLIFVVTADFHRLEHLSWDAGKQFDDKTGRALVNKIFPPKHCMHVPQWDLKDILNFSLTLYRSENDIVKQEQGESLEKLLSNLFGSIDKLPLNVVSSLLPYFPRGIENLYELLLPHGKNADSYTSVLGFVSILATCRNEPLLARVLKENKIRPWSAYLDLNDKILLPEQWGSLIDKAYHRPIWNLNKVQRLMPFNDVLYIKETENIIKIVGNRQAPLLHRQEYSYPLRDALEADHTLWAELLINLDLYSSIRYRVSLLTSWYPLILRIERACFQVPFPSWELRAFFTDNEGILSKATLFWLKTSDNGQLFIGWQPLFSGLREERNPSVSKLFNQLLVDTTQLTGNLPVEGDLHILPNKLWSLIVLVDALERCPWQAFSKFLNWLVVTYIALAAAFVRTAYFYTLEKSGYFKKNSQFSEIEKSFIGMLENQDPSFLLQYSANHSRTDLNESLEARVWHCLSELFAKDAHWQNKLKEESQGQTLVKATQCYLDSTMYQDVVALLQDTREFYSD